MLVGASMSQEIIVVRGDLSGVTERRAGKALRPDA
jgi:hypothetical protein